MPAGAPWDGFDGLLVLLHDPHPGSNYMYRHMIVVMIIVIYKNIISAGGGGVVGRLPSVIF